MRCVVGTGFINLDEHLNDIVFYVKAVHERLGERLAQLDVPAFVNGIAIYFYFERESTGRQPLHIRYDKRVQTLFVRFEIVPPGQLADAVDLVPIISTAWSSMLAKLAKYLESRGVISPLKEQLISSLALPVPSAYRS